MNKGQFGVPKRYGLVIVITCKNSWKRGKYKKLENTMEKMVTSTWANQRLQRDGNT